MTNTLGPISQDVAARYTIDVTASKFTLQAFSGGLLSAFGHNPVISLPIFSGEVHVDPQRIESASMHLTIQASALEVVSELSKRDRVELERVMHEQVLESDSYPEIVYNCSRVSASKTAEGQYWAALNGELTLHGVTHGQTLSARLSVNNDVLKASGYFSLLQSDYAIKLASFAAGTLKVKDELKCAFDIVAKRG